MVINLLKSILHNVGVLIVGFIFALIGKGLDLLFNFPSFHFLLINTAALLLLTVGFLIRVWATYQFYRQHMRVVSLKPQKKLVTTGAFSFSRNPLYLGGNIFIFFGATLLLGSPMAFVLTILNILVLHSWMIPREEGQLERKFGHEWIRYKKRVRRWL